MTCLLLTFFVERTKRTLSLQPSLRISTKVQVGSLTELVSKSDSRGIWRREGKGSKLKILILLEVFENQLAVFYASEVRFDAQTIQDLKENVPAILPVTSPSVSKKVSTPPILKRAKRKRRVSR